MSQYLVIFLISIGLSQDGALSEWVIGNYTALDLFKIEFQSEKI